MNIIHFIHDLTWDDLPTNVQHQARRCLLDIAGTAAAGSRTQLSAIIRDYAALAHGGSGASLWFDGRLVSQPGAALANGMTIDSLDAHDGHPLTKGHAGAAVVPAALAIWEGTSISGRELLTTIAMGYEIALRAGIALHASACDYHTSGAWNALGCAAIGARRLALDPAATRHALGIAEYHGPRSQMMRCIDHPTMVKDGSGWGAMAGVSAALLAQAGFTGAPALTVEMAQAGIWEELGVSWRMLEQYFKPYPVCRWAQAPIAAALALQQEHNLAPEDIRTVRVETFHEAVRLAHPRPETTEQAQYSLPFPLAAALVHGRLGGAAIDGPGLKNPQVLQLADRVELAESETFNRRFPAQRFARVVITGSDSSVYDSGEVETPWDAHSAPSDDELRAKFRDLAGESMPGARVEALLETIWRLDEAEEAAGLIEMMTFGI